MPRGDRTGPAGMGPMTGRGAGFCAGYATPGCINGGGWGAGQDARGGLGQGRGRRFRHRFFATGAPGWAAYAAPPLAPVAPGAETEALRRQAQALGAQLETIQQRLDALESEQSE